jgi:DNA-directed RNA polymerase specialized sigma24 family protein
MSDLDVRPAPSRVASASDVELALLLRRAARGDVGAFMRFYDATIPTVYAWARLRCARPDADPATVDRAVRATYARAWRRSAGHAGSGLSPKAWLLHHDPGG